MYLCVVHRDMCCQHNVGGGEGTIKKQQLKSTLDQLPRVKKLPLVKKTQKSYTEKRLGIGSPVFCIFFCHITQAFLKIW